MATGDAEKTVAYQLRDVAEITPQGRIHSTPAVRDASCDRSDRMMDQLYNPRTPERSRSETKRMPVASKTLPDAATLAYLRTMNSNRSTPMKLGKFDGTGSLESFLAQFEVCARHNRWDDLDKVDFLRCALDKAATQLLWDFGSREDISYEQLVERLRQRY